MKDQASWIDNCDWIDNIDGGDEPASGGLIIHEDGTTHPQGAITGRKPNVVNTYDLSYEAWDNPRKGPIQKMASGINRFTGWEASFSTANDYQGWGHSWLATTHTNNAVIFIGNVTKWTLSGYGGLNELGGGFTDRCTNVLPDALTDDVTGQLADNGFRGYYQRANGYTINEHVNNVILTTAYFADTTNPDGGIFIEKDMTGETVKIYDSSKTEKVSLAKNNAAAWGVTGTLLYIGRGKDTVPTNSVVEVEGWKVWEDRLVSDSDVDTSGV